MQIVSDFLIGILFDAGKRIEYSVLHMNLVQWAIFAITFLGLGMLSLRSQR